MVGPSGWVRDGIIFNDDDGDRTWDGVWRARTARRPDGWSVEMEIPYHVLRFGEKPVYTWGINAYRYISRHVEWTHWSFKPRGVNGWPSRFGHLEGIDVRYGLSSNISLNGTINPDFGQLSLIHI